MENRQKTEPKVFVILINWNQEQDVYECLDSLRKLHYSNYEVIVVDNASTDGSANRIKCKFPEIILLRNEENLGYAGGNNVGIKLALKHGAEYILLLNSDTVASKSLLSVLIEALAINKSLGIVGPAIYLYNEPNYLNFGVGNINRNTGFVEHFLKNGKYLPQYVGKSLIYCTFLTGCAMLIKRKVFEKVGFLDTDYFYLSEDTDFCVRAVDNNFKLAHIPKTKIWHKGASSCGGFDSPFRLYYETRNRLLFVKKNKRKFKWIKDGIKIFYNILFRIAYQLIRKGDLSGSLAISEGIADFLKWEVGKTKREWNV